MSPEPSPQFANSGELVTGTLRGFRSWNLAMLPLPMSPDQEHEYDLRRRRNTVRFQELDEIEIGTFGDPYLSMIQPRWTTRERPLDADMPVEYVLKAVSWNTFWSREAITANLCTQQGRFQRFLETTPGVMRAYSMTVNELFRYQSQYMTRTADRKRTLMVPFPSDHQIPSAACLCGLYGWYNPQYALHEHTGDVVGVIEVSGRILMGTMGFRAERARIIALAVNERCATPELHRRFMRLGTSDGSRYRGVEKLHGGVRELRARFKPDYDTLKNLGIDAEPHPDHPSSWSSGNWIGRLYRVEEESRQMFMIEMGGAFATGEHQPG